MGTAVELRFNLPVAGIQTRGTLSPRNIKGVLSTIEMGRKDNSSSGRSKLSVDQYRQKLGKFSCPVSLNALVSSLKGTREKHELRGRHRPRELRHKEIQNFQPTQQFQVGGKFAPCDLYSTDYHWVVPVM